MTYVPNGSGIWLPTSSGLWSDPRFDEEVDRCYLRGEHTAGCDKSWDYRKLPCTCGVDEECAAKRRERNRPSGA